MRRLSPTRVLRSSGLLGAIVVLMLLVGAVSPAVAAGPGVALAAPPLAGLLGDLADMVLGGVDWTVNVAGDFILNLLGGLVRNLIPRSWIGEGLSILGWIVAVPDYTAQIATPGGGRAYGFGGVNAIRGLLTWLGMAIAPLSLLYATSRAYSGQGDHVAAPLVRVFVAAIGVLSYTWLWGQLVALTNQITKAILGVGAVTTGIQKMFELLIAGTVLGGLPFIGLVLMGAGGVGAAGADLLEGRRRAGWCAGVRDGAVDARHRGDRARSRDRARVAEPDGGVVRAGDRVDVGVRALCGVDQRRLERRRDPPAATAGWDSCWAGS